MNRLRGTRRSHRRLLHLLLWTCALFTAWATLALTVPDSTPPRQLLSLALAYTSFAAILVTLGIGPFNVLTGRRNPLSTDLRRDAGLAATVSGAVHTIISLTNHFGGDVVAYFLSRRALALDAIRRDVFGLGAWTGLAAAILLVVLGTISSDVAMRRLGRARWKRVQRSNYVLLVLAAIHTAAFWAALDRGVLVIGLTTLAATGVVVLQTAGAARTVSGRETS